MKNIGYKKGVVFGIVVLFICVSFTGSSLGFSINESQMCAFEGNTLYVGGIGPNNYTKIQDAVDNSSDGDTVYVFDESSPYYENVFVSKSINLIGEDKNTTIIDANGSKSVVKFAANYITVSGFTLQNSGNVHDEDSGVEISSAYYISDYCTITDNIIKNNWDGIHSIFSSGCLISGNIIMNNRNHGIYLRSWCDGYNISYNIIKDNIDTGLTVYQEGNFIFRNIVENNYIGIHTSNDAFENVVRNNNIGIKACLASISRNIVENNNIGISEYAEHTKIKYNNLLNNDLHVTFEENVLFLFFLFIPTTEWKHNYYEGHGARPKIIWGTVVFYFSEFRWINIDWSPSKEPNDLSWLEEEIKSKIKI